MPRSRVFSIRTRLTLVVGLSVGAAFLGALLVTLAVLNNSLAQRDRNELENELENLLREYQIGGLRAVREEIEVRRLLGRDRPYFARVATPANQTRLASVPRAWQGFEFEQLSRAAPEALPQLQRLESNEADFSVLVGTGRVEDGIIIQVGLSTQVRRQVVAIVGTTFVTFIAPSLVAIILLLVFAVRRVVRPIADLTAAVHEVIENGDYSRQVTTPHRSLETDRLISGFNTLMSRVSSLVAHLRQTLDALAHDIRTPVTRMRAQMELSLSRAESVSEYRRIVSDSLDETSHIISLVRRFLDASEAESGEVKLNREEVDMEEVVADVVEAHRLSAQAKQIRIQCSATDAGSAEVDSVRIQQALSNLLENAVKFSLADTVVFVELEGDEECVRISVRDQGPGIPEEQLSEIWSYQYSRSHIGGSGGYGLGLTIVRAVAEAHGGSVDARNNEAGGAVFTLRIPRRGPKERSALGKCQ